MAEFKHPYIIPTGEIDATPECLFAQEAVEMLGSYACIDVMQVGTETFETSTTPRVEVDSSSVFAAAFRLRVVPAFHELPLAGIIPEAVPKSRRLTFNPDMLLVLLQYGELHDESIDEPGDDHFKWSPYVVAMVPTQNVAAADVLDAKTGSSLSRADIAIARQTLGQLHQEYRADAQQDDTINHIPDPVLTDGLLLRAWPEEGTVYAIGTFDPQNLTTGCGVAGLEEDADKIAYS